MPWLVWIWSAAWAACGMLALIHVFLWITGSRRPVALLPALAAIAAAVTAHIEYRLFSSTSIAAYETLVLWENLVIAFVIVPMVWFLRAHLGTGRRWLAIAITALWGAGLIANFGLPGSLTFTEIQSLEPLTTPWGEQFVIARGTVNPWSALANVASILFIGFVIDASIQAWRIGKHHQAVLIGGSMAVFILVAGIHTPLVDTGTIQSPYMVSFAFLLIVAAQTYSVARDAVRASRLSREVEHRQRRWLEFFDAVQLAALEVDNEGIVRFVNPHLVRLSGYAESDLLGQPVHQLIEPESRGELATRLAEAANIGPRPVSQWVLRRANGEKHFMLWSSVSLRDLDGTISGILSVGTDVTEQLRAQSELRTAQREMDRLLRASMLGELTSTIAHELNQPLAAILSNAQTARLLLSREDPDLAELREIIEDVIQDDKRAGEVIHGLRSILRKEEVGTEIVDLRVAVETVVRLIRAEFESGQIKFDLDVDANLPAVLGSRVQIEQVFMNLLLNAVRAVQSSPSERRRIRLHARSAEDRLVVRVTDTGPGIEADLLPSVFEPFYTTRQTGLGMGLSICRRIVSAHGGEIWAENVEGVGAEFGFWLPQALEKEEAHGG